MTEGTSHLAGFNAVCDDVRARWVMYFDSTHFAESVPLATKIDLFLPVAGELIRNKYPLLQQAPSEAYWLIIFTSILEAQTHSKEAVNAAIQDLERKHHRKPSILDRARKWLRDKL